jgi:hypothetical protein
MKKIFLLLVTIIFVQQIQAQYCTTSLPFSTADEEILNVTFAGQLANATTCGNSLFGTQCNGTTASVANRYVDFSGCAPASVLAGQIYPFTVLVGSCGTFNFPHAVKIYIDYNQDLDFVDPGEEVYFSGTTALTCVPPTTVSGNINIPVTATPGLTRMRIIDQEQGQISATAITPCGGYGYGETEDYTINIIAGPPCSGTPTAGTVNAPDTIKVCPSNPTQLCATGTTIASNLKYRWLKSLTGNSPWTPTSPADTFLCYTVPAGTPNAFYRFFTFCPNSFGSDTTNNKVYVELQNPTYAPLPYAQDFEAWKDYCSTKDVPNDNHWRNGPVNGNNSWRRNDEGNTGGWTNPTNGNYIPPASSGNHSARFHSYYATAPGNLDLHVDLSGSAGPKDLLFDLKHNNFDDSLEVSLSTNGGTSFTLLNTFGGVFNWATQLLTITSSSSTCVIRFSGRSNSFASDQGIDNIKVLPPCTGTPTAGIIPDTSACPNDSFLLKILNGSAASGLVYTWESAPTTTGPWTFYATTSQPQTNIFINTPTYFRATVLCAASNLSAQTPVQFTNINAFYYCYCKNGSNGTSDGFDIGNVQVLKKISPIPTYDTLIFNVPLGPADTFLNLSAIKSYTNHQFSLPISKLYKDSTYLAKVYDIAQFSFSPFASTKIFIDYNRDGDFNDLGESVGGNSVGNDNGVTLQFTVPASASNGITGMRVITADGNSPNAIDPCISFQSGEVEDYLVEIFLPPCQAPTNAGIAYVTDSLFCPGYTTILFDTSHVKLTDYVGLSIQWQSSNNNLVWTNIAGATSDSLTTIVNSPTYFRLRVICSGQDTVYSNVKLVNMLPAAGCYPASGSFGGITDSSDNGYFSMAGYNFSSGGATGPHLGNPAAVRSRTDFSNLSVINLYNDSTYTASFYNILKPYFHADARITMFIDYNNNGIYDIPTERVVVGTSSANSFYLPQTFKTIVAPVFNKNTGMRVILNNNIAPNNQSDNGVGIYVSGETEDYTVKFIKKPVFPLSVNDVISLNNVTIYPNPSNGIVFVDLEAYALPKVDIIVTNLTGSTVHQTSINNVNGKQSTTLDLSDLAKGTYIIKLQSERGTVVQKVTLQ